MLNWPPQLPTEKVNQLSSIAIDWATLNGLVIRSMTNDIPTAVHAPFSLFPCPFPHKPFELAIKLQPLFNLLVDKVARDDEFLCSIMDSLSTADEFTNQIYQIYLQTRNHTQSIWMGIHRSDYMLDTIDGELGIKQVELNTISSSFSSLSSKTRDLHEYLSAKTGFFNELAPNQVDIEANMLPRNNSGTSIAKALAKAHQAYGVESAQVVMIVQPEENNIFDQRWIEQELCDKFGVKMIRATLASIKDIATLTIDKRLMIHGVETSVVYYRAGYAPTDYPSQIEWDARFFLEISYAVKCPNAAYHLVGAKKIQQVLANPTILERFVTKKQSDLLMKCFTGLYPLDQSPEGLQAYQMALENPSRYVLKPQREGGGNNFYGQDIPTQLLKMNTNERNGFILMDLIKPPPLKNVMIRKGKVIEAQVVSELGIYGIWVSDGDVCLLNEDGGHLLRTKSTDSNEGGVAAGFAVLDSPLLQ